MTEVLLQPPVVQFCDGNGHPYAAGTLETYIVNTTTPKNTWQDSLGSVLNTNPVVLDSAGRCILYGDGAYRFVLRDSTGNLIWDLPTSSLVSAAMAPVVEAPDLASARDAMGITALLNAEAAARAAADAAETTRAESAEGTLLSDLNAEIAARVAGDAALTTALNNEIARATAAEAGLASSISALGGPLYVKTGTGVTDSSGRFNVSFSPPFPNGLLTFTAKGGYPAAPPAYASPPNFYDGSSIYNSVVGYTTSGGALITIGASGVFNASLGILGAYDPSWPYEQMVTSFNSGPFRWWATGW